MFRTPVDIVMALPVYALVLFRLTGLMLTAPLFGSELIPVRIRAAFVLVVAAMIFPLVAPQAPAGLSLGQVAIGGLGELLVGASIGLALTILFMGAELAGLMVGRQAGLALADVFDPSSGEQTTVVGQIYTIVLVLVFLVAGGHRAAMAALLDSYKVTPLLSASFSDSIVLLMVEMLASASILGIRLAVPVLAALFLTGLAMAFLSRTMPQLNILSVGFVLRAMIALAVAALALPSCEDLLLDAIDDTLGAIRTTLGIAGTTVEGAT